MTGPAVRWAEEDLAGLEARGLLRRMEAAASAQGPELDLGGERLINFSSNDYLGLAAHPAVIAAAQAAAGRWGTGAGASRLVVGDLLPHRSLEARVARLKGREAAAVFSSGYAANLGAVSALVGPGDVVLSDELNHASLIDGCRLSRARVEVYPHRDVAAVERLLAGVQARRVLVVTDAVFSMDGDVAPLEALSEACRAHGAALLVDEAHATGVLGPSGAGACAAAGISPDVMVVTLSKALGAQGGVVVGDAPLVELVINRARSFVFSTGLSPVLCAAAEAAIDVLEAEPERLARLWRNVERLAAGLERLGHPAPGTSPIAAVVLGSPARALEVARTLREAGVLVKAIRPPTVPEGTSRLRVVVTAAHEPGHLDQLLGALPAVTRGRPAVTGGGDPAAPPPAPAAPGEARTPGTAGCPPGAAGGTR